VITHGFRKPKPGRLRQEIERAERLRREWEEGGKRYETR